MNIITDSFQQNPVTYSLELKVKFKALPLFIEFCETLSDSIVYFEAEDTKTIDSKPEDLWQINVYLDKKIDINDVDQKFSELATASNIEKPLLNLVQVDNLDWVSEVQKTFVPIRAGKFFIHYSGFEENLPKDLINIEINAGRAFGTGEHETTSNCLIALSEFVQNDLNIALDMGCGSGILAIAMAKLNIEKIIAVDIDEQALIVTEENKRLNHVQQITVKQSDGYHSDIIRENAPYQIITSNILALPLISMATDAAKNLSEDGILILAGFLKDQQLEVLNAHKQQGLILVKEICIKNWPTLVMKKSVNGK